MGLTIAILAYHEAENLKWLLPELKKVIAPLGIDSVEYLIIDSAEPTDNTNEVCQEFGARYVNQEGPGYGNAYRTAIRYAREDLFLVLDADGSQDYTQIPVMYQEILAGADIVIGSRYVTGGNTSDAKSSQIMSYILNTAFRLGIGVNVRDFSGSFRICHTQALRELHLIGQNFDILEEIILKLKLSKQRPIMIKEVPISFKKRVIGESKRSLGKFVVCFGQMLLYSLVLRALAGRKYSPGGHDIQAKRITEMILSAGVITIAVVVNVVIFSYLISNLGYFMANLIAWLVALPIAFVTDKIFVTNDWNWSGDSIRQGFWNFVKSKALLSVLETLVLWIMVDILVMRIAISKFVSVIAWSLLNVILSIRKKGS